MTKLKNSILEKTNGKNFLPSLPTVSSIKQDANSIISAVQSYYLINKKIDKISDSINLNTSIWDVNDKSVKYLENEKTCIEISIVDTQLKLTIDSTVGSICKELEEKGINSNIFELN